MTIHTASLAQITRIARALIGITPAQLAADIGAGPTLQLAAIDRPLQSAEALEKALRVIIGWYQDELDDLAEPARSRQIKMTFDDLVRQYLALRSEWESREAAAIVAMMGDTLGTRSTRGGLLSRTV